MELTALRDLSTCRKSDTCMKASFRRNDVVLLCLKLAWTLDEVALIFIYNFSVSYTALTQAPAFCDQ